MNREKIGPSCLIALSIFICIYSFKLKIGSLSNPGSGFMPFIAGLLFGLLSLLQIVKLYSSRGLREKGESPETHREEGQLGNFWKIIVVCLSLIAYIIVVSKLGYFISTFLLLSCLFRIGKPMKYWFILAFSFFLVFLASRSIT